MVEFGNSKITEMHRFSLNSPLFSPVKNGPQERFCFHRTTVGRFW